jgi:uncharacterized protein (DUF305 family)
MRHHAKLIAALSASACAGFALAALILPVATRATPQTFAAQLADPASICRGTAEVSPFYSEVTAAGARMHQGMNVATGNIDLDFTRMMIPHHQGAIDMALALLKYGQNEKLKRLAQSIVVEQSQEIAYMRTFLAPPDGAAAVPEHTAQQ